MKKEKEILHNIRLSSVREAAMEAGARDGRFRQRAVKCKKAYDRNKAKKDLRKELD